MTPARLLGSHSHQTPNGHHVTIVMRDGRYLARGRLLGRQWGYTLGANEQEAGLCLSRLLTELTDGLFEPSSTAHRNVLPRGPVPKLSLCDLCNLFLLDVAETHGRQLQKSYLDRLAHCLAFAEQPQIIRRWKLASDINREFTLQLRSHLMQSPIRRNGKPGAAPQAMSVTTVRLCLETLRTLFHWAKRPEIRKLPADFLQPITPEILGPIAVKSPVRPIPLTLEQRIDLVHAMDEWQLRHVAILFVIPSRFEDVAGALISDFDLNRLTWMIGTRFGGADYTKGKTEVRMPLPAILGRLLSANIGDRKDGPMFLRRRYKTCETELSREAIEARLNHLLLAGQDASQATPQGRKLACRRLLAELGAVSTDEISGNIERLYAQQGITGVRPYDVRHSATTDMYAAGLTHLALRYLTLHAASDILNVYTSINAEEEMSKYYRRVQPLLDAIAKRAETLGILEFGNL